MTTVLTTTPAERLSADLLVIPVAQGAVATHPAVRALDRQLGGRLLAEVRRSRFRGTQAHELVYQTHGAARAGVIVLAGVGAAPSLGVWYDLADAVTRHSGLARARHAAVALGPHASSQVV